MPCHENRGTKTDDMYSKTQASSIEKLLCQAMSKLSLSDLKDLNVMPTIGQSGIVGVLWYDIHLMNDIFVLENQMQGVITAHERGFLAPFDLNDFSSDINKKLNDKIMERKRIEGLVSLVKSESLNFDKPRNPNEKEKE